MNSDWVNALQQAAALFGRGESREAGNICRRLLARHPGAVDARHLLALILKQEGKFRDAEREFRDCIEAAPRRADIRANFANLLVATGESDRAIEAYRAALTLDPAFRPARLGLARQLNRIRDGDAAAREAEFLIAKNARDAEALNALGIARRLTGDMAAAEQAFCRALDVQPGYAVARHNLGALYARLSRSEEALAELDAAAAAGIRGGEIDLNRASALMQLARFDEAESLLEHTVVSSPDNVEAHTLLARIRFMRDKQDFADTFATAFAAAPENVDLCLAYSRVLRGAQRFGRALEVVERAMQAGAANARYLAELAAVYQDAGQFDQALEKASAAKAADPQDSAIDDILIDALVCLGRADEAVPLVQAARQRQPLNQWYVAMQATVARLLGDPLYEELYDYEALVRPYELPVPEGWSSLEAFHSDLIPALVARHRFKTEPLDQSLRHGTQTPRSLLGDPDPAIRAFLDAIREPIARYREAMGYDPQHPLRSRNVGESRLTGCWSVRLSRGGYHVNHVHSEGWISSAYYVEVPPEVEDEENKSGWIKFGEPRFEVPGAAPAKFVRPAAGRLVLFPSYMWHGTTPIRGGETRMTIAFDVVPVQPAD